MNIFCCDNPEKSIMTSLPVNFALLMLRPTNRHTKTSDTKQKQSRPAKNSGTNKCAKKIGSFDFYLVFGLITIVSK